MTLRRPLVLVGGKLAQIAPGDRLGASSVSGGLSVPVGPASLSGHSAVALDAAGELIAADCTDASQLGTVVGVLSGAYAPGSDAEVIVRGPLEHAGWTWSVGPVFVGQAGQLVQSLPTGAIFSQVIGHALSATRISISVQPPVFFT